MDCCIPDSKLELYMELDNLRYCLKYDTGLNKEQIDRIGQQIQFVLDCIDYIDNRAKDRVKEIKTGWRNA